MKKDRIETALKDHLEWVHSNGSIGKKAILIREHFYQHDLHDVLLSEAILTQSDLSRANLPNANLSYADMERVNLRSSNLKNANLSNTVLKNANLIDSDISGADLTGANLLSADLRGAKLIDTVLKSANLNGCYLTDSNLTSADLSNTDLRNSILNNTILSRANLTGANLSNAKLINVDLSGAIFRDTNFSNVKIDPSTIRQLPEEIVNKYGDRFIIFGLFEIFPSIVRFIEFPPEYFSAGVSTLHAFGNVLKAKFPKTKSKLRIEQEGNKVTMIIQTPEGDKEIIESELYEYGLVITGQKPVEEYTTDPLLTLKIKDELIYARARIESQKELLGYQHEELESLKQIILSSFKQPFSFNINQNVNLEINPKIRLVFGALNELKDQADIDSEDKKDIEDLQNSLNSLKNYTSKDEIAESSALSKLVRFIKNVGDDKTRLGKTVNGIKNGFQIVKDLTGFYNEIAKWCGLPPL